MSALKQRQYRDCVGPLQCPELKRTLFSVLPHCEWETWFWSEALLFSGTLCQVENQTPLPLGKLENHFLSSESKSYYFQKKPYTLKEGQNYKDLFLYRGKDDNTLLPQKLQKHRLEFFSPWGPRARKLKESLAWVAKPDDPFVVRMEARKQGSTSSLQTQHQVIRQREICSASEFKGRLIDNLGPLLHSRLFWQCSRTKKLNYSFKGL